MEYFFKWFICTWTHVISKFKNSKDDNWMGHLTLALLCGMFNMPSVEHSKMPYLVIKYTLFFSTIIWAPCILMGTESLLIPRQLSFIFQTAADYRPDGHPSQKIEVKRVFGDKHVFYSASNWILSRILS